MAARENTPAPVAPGAKVVEVLGNSISGTIGSLAVRHAFEAYRDKLTEGGRTPDTYQSLELRVLEAHWQQLATATTPVGGGS
jgi:hypothetical protein